MELQNKKFQEILKTLKIATGDIVPICECLLFEKNAIVANNTQNEARYSIDTGFKTSAVIHCKTLWSFLAKFDKSDYVKIEQLENEQINITVKSTTITLKQESSAEDWISRTKGFMKFNQSITPNMIQKIKTASSYVSDHELRPAMNCVAITKKMVAATNGNVCFKTDFDLEYDKTILLNTQFTQLLDAKQPAIISLCNKKENFKIEVTQGKFTFTTKNIDERFPDFSNVYPEKKSIVNSAFFNPKQLLKELKPIQAVNSFAKLNYTKEGLQVTAIDLELDTEIKVDLQYKSLQPFEFLHGIDINLFLQMVQTLYKTEDMIKVSYTESNAKAILINDNLLIMPMTIKEYA